jgi:signal transduction histidine kinase
MQLFRIAQEAVNNAIHHGRVTTRIDVTVVYDSDAVALTIKDDGCGFTVGEEAAWRQAGEHFGLVTMRERAERLGGQLRIVSAPGQGTTVQTEVKVTSEWV